MYRDPRDAVIAKLEAELSKLRLDQTQLRADVQYAKEELARARKWEAAANMLRKEVTRLTLELSALDAEPDPYVPIKRSGALRYEKNNAVKTWDDYETWLDSRIDEQLLDFVEAEELEQKLVDPLYELIEECFYIETRGWAAERPAAAMRRLRGCTGFDYKTVVFWSNRALAFTGPGPYVYISREVLSRGLSDEGLVFILAHELAHHELGHVGTHGDLFSQCLSILKRTSDDELAADAKALDWCNDLGVGLSGAESAFRLLRRFALDFRALDGVFDFAGLWTSTAVPQKLLRKVMVTHPPIDVRLRRLKERSLKSGNHCKVL